MKTLPLSTRRDFIKLGSFGAVAGLTSIPILSEAKSPINEIPKGLRVLFQGDSITDAGRNRGAYYANNGAGMGSGYVYQIVSQLLAKHPDKDLKFYNRGISGNKVFQLANRWEDDCMQLQPDVLSILIGVNDYWHTLSHHYQGTPEIFEQDLRQLLKDTTERFPNMKLILGEPFAVKGGSAIGAEWAKNFPAYQQVIRNLATEMNTGFIPFQQVFDEALELAPVQYWCPDGVHPSIAGAALMKTAWLVAFNQLWS